MPGDLSSTCVHYDYHSPAHGPVHNPESKFCNNPKRLGLFTDMQNFRKSTYHQRAGIESSYITLTYIYGHISFLLTLVPYFALDSC